MGRGPGAVGEGGGSLRPNPDPLASGVPLLQNFITIEAIYGTRTQL